MTGIRDQQLAVAGNSLNGSGGSSFGNEEQKPSFNMALVTSPGPRRGGGGDGGALLNRERHGHEHVKSKGSAYVTAKETRRAS